MLLPALLLVRGLPLVPRVLISGAIGVPLLLALWSGLLWCFFHWRTPLQPEYYLKVSTVRASCTLVLATY
jgi:hypothetical protein